MISILSSIVNIIGGTYMVNNEQKNFHFDSELKIRMSSKNHDESGYGLDFDSLAISLVTECFIT